MKRLFISALLIMIFCFPVLAEVVIEAEGTGKTLNEAKANARTALAEKVFPGTVIVETKTSVADSSSGEYSSSFSQKSSYSIVGEFPGFDYTVVSSKKNNYVVTTKIVGDFTTLNFYGSRLDEQKENVEEFYRRYLALGSEVSASERRKALALVIEYYYYYNMYGNIILSLGGTPDDVDIPETLAVLQVDYQSLLDEEQNELLAESSVSTITQEIKDELMKNAEDREEYLKAREEARAQSELQRKLILDQKIADIVNNAGSISFSDIGNSLGLRGYESYIEVVKDADSSFVEACREYDKLIKEQSDSIEEAFLEEAEAIRNRTYPIAHLDSDGDPTEIAEKARESEIDKLRAEKDKEKEEASSVINEKLCSEIQKRYDYLEEAVEQLESREFRVYSSNGEAEISATPKYDGTNFCWNLQVYVDEPLSVDLDGIKLSYTDLMGSVVPEKESEVSEFVLSSGYVNAVETYTRLLTLGEYEFSLSFKVDLRLNGEIVVKPQDLEIKFADGKDVSITFKEFDAGNVSIDLDAGDYLGYSWLKKGDEGKEIEEVIFETSNPGIVKKVEKRKILGLELNGQAMLMYENPFIKDRTVVTVNFFAEGRLFLYDFFISVSGNFSIMNVSDLKLDKNHLIQFGAYGGVGYRLFDIWTLFCRTSYNKTLGLLLNPCISVGYYQDAFRLDVVFGAYVSCKTWKTVLSFGAAIGWRVF